MSLELSLTPEGRLRIIGDVDAAPVVDDPNPSFGIYNAPPWRFDRDAGLFHLASRPPSELARELIAVARSVVDSPARRR